MKSISSTNQSKKRHVKKIHFIKSTTTLTKLNRKNQETKLNEKMKKKDKKKRDMESKIPHLDKSKSLYIYIYVDYLFKHQQQHELFMERKKMYYKHFVCYVLVHTQKSTTYHNLPQMSTFYHFYFSCRFCSVSRLFLQHRYHYWTICEQYIQKFTLQSGHNVVN